MIERTMMDPDADFAGSDYDREEDHPRLAAQMARIFAVMSDGQWHTKHEIAAKTGDPEASILAQLGHFRKERFGAYAVDKRVVGHRSDGLWEYRMGEPGSHVQRPHPLAVRAQRAERLANRAIIMAIALAKALEKVAPDSPVLVTYRKQFLEEGR